MALPPTEHDVDTVIEFTGFPDRKMIYSALRAKNNDVEAVAMEIVDSLEKFTTTYGWDETAFSLGRDGDEPTAPHTTNPSFVIHSADNNEVLYGTEPNEFYGGTNPPPSRPPSRANNRSPIGRMVDLQAAQFTANAPSNLQEEEAALRRAINESLHTSGVQSPQALSPPPPLPQQSGITGDGDTSVYFGPANRTDYNPNEWAMVEVKRREADPAPPLRKRKPDAPVFLRCRFDDEWKKHRIGGILMILHAIPAVRNALLRTGSTPEYGYGSNAEWWRGEVILSPARQAAREAQEPDIWASEIFPTWTDELHRLIAFLDSTDRSYGTADILAESTSAIESSGDRERDFFEAVLAEVHVSKVFRNTVEIVPVLGDAPPTSSAFTVLDTTVARDNLLAAETLYNVWDMIFYNAEELEMPRIAMITELSEVITFRPTGVDALPTAIDIPETFYVDRYLASKRDQMQQIQLDTATVTAAYKKSQQLEEELTKWVNPKTNKIRDRRLMNRLAAERCQEKIGQIKTRAFWRDHEAARARGEDTQYYLADHEGEPNLEPDEVEIIQDYENRIKNFEQQTAEIEQIMEDTILPERKQLEKMSRYLGALLTVPSDDPKWNPTHKYTLRGVVGDINRVYVRKREPALMDLEEDDPPSEQWWKMSCALDNDNAATAEMVPYETVMREACGTGSKPILIYTTDRAMEEIPDPLSDALKTFVKFDNRHYKQELAQVERQQETNPQVEEEWSGIPPGMNIPGMRPRKQRSGSMDSMATNEASAGDLDEDMRDAPFDQEDVFGGGDGTVGDDSREATLDEQLPDLIDVSDDATAADNSHMERLARVSLDDDAKDAVPQEMQEMQERGHSPLLTRPPGGAFFADTTDKERENKASVADMSMGL
ncbi:hypothetical protein B0T25DRAFT_588029 [Lasiosphaeria hispida]|uniref:Ubiquitin interaction domain-containing protein n=1 Tax=Lasiosphaeria hispida TaxID=260671 RepID=A0AAJ0HPH6_9PEZI|nr:hypothetical protein B0T25DRAFT_588029 [Lasiosphaeria hispida]